MASESSSVTSIPEIPPESPGSSVSSRLQEEYEELLKYAVVVPTFDKSTVTPKTSIDQKDSAMPQTTTLTTDQIKTTTSQIHSDKQDSEEKSTPRIDDSTGSTVQHLQNCLPDFGPSPIPVNQDSNSSSETLEKPDDVPREKPSFPIKHFAWQGPNQSKFQSLDNIEYERDEHDNLVYTATVDHDIGKMENVLDQWGLDLKRNILAEFGQAKIKIVENARNELHKEQERNLSERNKLLNEIDSLKELLHTYEQSMERKDQVISNLTHAMQKQKDRKDMMKQFCEWKIKHNDVKREVFTSNLAKRHYERCLSQKVWLAWHSIIENNWRSRVERACQTKAQEVCMQLTNDYEMKIAAMNEDLEGKRQEIEILHSDRDRYEEAMKKAFMRGVCALNLEAMNMFHGSEEEHNSKTTHNDMYSDNLDGHFPQKDYGTSKTIPRDSTESLPSRIVTSQGSRPHSVVQAKSVISKQTSIVSTSSSKSKPSSKVSSKTSTSHKTSRPSTGPVTLAPPMASVVVERHPPVNKQTIGQATASKFPRGSQPDSSRSYKRLAGQSGTITITPHIQSVKVVD